MNESNMNISLKLVVVTVFLIKSLQCNDSNNDTLVDTRTTRTSPNPSWNQTNLDKLRNDLLTNYDKYARPDQHYNVTTVAIGMGMNYIETDELNSTVSVLGWLRLQWIDSKLKWNPEDYGGITLIKMADHEIWQPDIHLYNSALGGEAVTRYANRNAQIFSNGKVYWVPPTKLTALCEFDLFYWPFDTQHCYLELASWTRSGKEIKLEFDSNEYFIDRQPLMVMSPWKVDVTDQIIEKYHDCCPDAFYNAQINLTLTRKSSSYISVVITPGFAVVSLILIQCCLRWYSGERIILSCCTAIVVTILLTHFTQKMSAMGSHTPWIVTFYIINLYIVAFSIAESIFVIVLLKSEQKTALPWYIKSHLQGRFGKLLLLEYYTTSKNEPAEEMKNYHLSEFDDKIDDSDTIIKYTTKCNNEREWEIVAVALDRTTFIIYCTIYFILFLYYII